MDYLPIQKFSNLWNISKRRIQILCKEERIPGAKMIGNMWVIPENTKRPVDARVNNPIVKAVNDGTNVRKELKKLLKDLYDSCAKNNIAESNRKDYVLSIIAAQLCSLYMGEKVDDNVLSIIYRDVSSKKETLHFKVDDLNTVHDFIDMHKTDEEVDDILSWAYQYSNKFIKDNAFSKTQFFTEKYMIKYLIKSVPNLKKADKILDPCVGGGNFLAECLDELCSQCKSVSVRSVIDCCSRLYGFDIDKKITGIAVVNIRLRALSILKRKKVAFGIDIWGKINPNIYMSIEYDNIQGSLAMERKKVINITNNSITTTNKLFTEADVVLTNPPFATIKGMNNSQKDFLKRNYPQSNCDTCVAFLEAIGNMLSKGGICGIVSQSAWMHLKSFKDIRNWVVSNYRIKKIINLGSGAFQDLSGEKSNVALMVFSKDLADKEGVIKIANISASTYLEKISAVGGLVDYIEKKQSEINGVNGFEFTINNILNDLKGKTEPYKEIAVPMQGTSTGNAKELVGYFWEHFGENKWINVSNGGGYCRWQGLNDSVVKWGHNGEYIKEQKGSALRNARYFSETQMVFSDTGTAGLNVRVLHKNQIFIASGPGIRVKKGNEYAQMALLNSRIASYCIRLMSPKLTIAAGYIGQLPINEEICSSIVLEKEARLCIELKEKMLSTRASNIEYSDEYIYHLPQNTEKAAWALFNEDITNELMKLEVENKIDRFITKSFGLSDDEQNTLDENVGKCAYEISGVAEIDEVKLDKYLDKLLDNNCCLKRTKSSKDSLGSDGYLEYIAKDLNINPEIIVKRIQENPYKFRKVLSRYRNLLFHNYVLHCMGYKTCSGVSRKKECINVLINKFEKDFGESDFKYWIGKSFNEVHSNIFKGRPYLIYDKGAIHLNDRLIKR